jgi:hypothetical protein
VLALPTWFCRSVFGFCYQHINSCGTKKQHAQFVNLGTCSDSLLAQAASCTSLVLGHFAPLTQPPCRSCAAHNNASTMERGYIEDANGLPMATTLCHNGDLAIIIKEICSCTAVCDRYLCELRVIRDSPCQSIACQLCVFKPSLASKVTAMAHFMSIVQELNASAYLLQVLCGWVD